MKKIAIGAVIVGVVAIAIMGFGPRYSAQNLMTKLDASWEGHTARDLEFRDTFYALVGKVAAQNPAVQEKFKNYKSKLDIDDEEKLVNLIFLLRRAVDKDSLYAGLEKWGTLSAETQNKIIENFGPTYRAIAEGSLEDNLKFVSVLEKRKTNLAGVVGKMPQAFKDTVANLEPSEVDEYVDCLYLLMLNSVAVMKFLGNTAGEKEDL